MSYLYLPINRPGLRCFNDTGDCAVPCDQSRGFVGPCSRPRFFSLTASATQPANWAVLETPTGLAMKWNGGLVSSNSWVTQFYPAFPNVIYFTVALSASPGDVRAEHHIRFTQLCDADLPTDPPVPRFWTGRVITTNALTQSQVIFNTLAMDTSPLCSLSWPVPPFRVFPQGCCDGNFVKIEEEPP